MPNRRLRIDRRRLLPWVALVLVVGSTLAAAFAGAVLGAGAAAAAAVALVLARRPGSEITLSDRELDQLRRAELALAEVDDVEAAAQQLAEHAVSLLGARAAVVLIEGIGDTVRRSTGPNPGEDVYGSGSRMRLLDDAGVPCGSIAVSARADGRPYGDRHERILDVLAERVSATLHRVSLLTEVRTERQAFSDLVSSSSDGIFAVGADLRVRIWNPAMARITGVPVQAAVGRHLNESFAPTTPDGEAATGAGDPGRALRTRVPGAGGDEPVLLRIVLDDEERWLTCSYAPLSDGGYVVVARDDTERKKVEDDKNGWIAQVSHELRTPLTPIKGFVKTLAARDADLTSEERSRIYEIVLREEERLEELVDAMMRTTQLDSRRLSVAVEEFDWLELVTSSTEQWRRKDPSRDWVVEIEPSSGATIRSDRSLAQGILTSLLSNACKFTPPGTPIQVSVRVAGDEIVTDVVDHGPGIARSDRDRVFNKFGRLGSHLTRHQQGVGLGLHNSRRCAEQLGGRLWVEATPGGGATFRLALPMAAPEPASGSRDAATDAVGA